MKTNKRDGYEKLTAAGVVRSVKSFIANFPLSATVKGLKSVNIWRRYEQVFGVFLDSRYTEFLGYPSVKIS